MSTNDVDLTAARKGTPHFAGAYHKEVTIGARGFCCIGEYPPMDHPHIYQHIPPGRDFIYCHYCSTKFIYDETLPETGSLPICYVKPETLYDAESIPDIEDNQA